MKSLTTFFSMTCLLTHVSMAAWSNENTEQPKSSFKDAYGLFIQGGIATGSDAHYSSLGGYYNVYNVAVDVKHLRGEDVVSGYIGMGIEDAMQFQLGYGNLDSVILRVQGAWSFHDIAQRKMSLIKRPLSLADRFLLNFGGEHYFSDRDYSHIYIGLGFRFL